MVDVVDEMLVVQRGKELGYRLSDEQFTGILDNIKKDNKIENDEQFQAALKQENMTLADLRRNLERQMIVSARPAERGARQGSRCPKRRRASTTTRTSRSSRRRRRSRCARSSWRCRATATVNVGAGRERRARRPTQIRQRALAGESFEKLAAELSDAPSKANAGLIGPLNLDDLSPDLRKLIEAMKVGEISELLRTPRGYQILKLESSTPPETLPFEQAREQISERVFTDKRRAEFEKYLEQLRAQAIIEWKNEDVKKAYEQGLSAEQAAGRRAAAPRA